MLQRPGLDGQQCHNLAHTVQSIGNGSSVRACGSGGGQVPAGGPQRKDVSQRGCPRLFGEGRFRRRRRFGRDKCEAQAEDKKGCERENGVPEIAHQRAVFLVVLFHNRPWCHAKGGTPSTKEPVK
jgi:hypothetical protein